MDAIYFSAWYGDVEKKVELSIATYGGDGYQILINRYYYGIMIQRAGKWVGYLNPRAWEELTTDDVRILGEIIEDALKSAPLDGSGDIF